MARTAILLTASRWPVAAVCLALLPLLAWFGNPAAALLVGAGIAVMVNRPPVPAAAGLAQFSLMVAIVLLGLKLDLGSLWALGAKYAWLVTAYVLITFAAGLLLGRLLAVEAHSARLMSAGTAICGGTAIASLSAVVRAHPRQTGVALAIVFLLNVVAMVSFPAIGRTLALSQEQFGLWAALAVHDTSAVVATATVYGSESAEVATTLKLGRTLWLIPLIFLYGTFARRGTGGEVAVTGLRLPLFVFLFVAAAGLGSVSVLPAAAVKMAGIISGWLLVTALFLVGTTFTRDTVREIRGRVLWQALALWLAVVGGSLAAVIWLG